MDYHSVTEFCTPLINDGTQVQVLRVFLTIDTDRRKLERIATILHAPQGLYAMQSASLSGSAISVHTGTPQKQSRKKGPFKISIVFVFEPWRNEDSTCLDELRYVIAGENSNSANNAQNRECSHTQQHRLSGNNKARVVSGPRPWIVLLSLKVLKEEAEAADLH